MSKQTASVWANRPALEAKPQHTSRQGRKTVVVKQPLTTAQGINQFLKRCKAVRG